ncbi:RagB/SusD family nutrient uptake outer membrane protein [Porphyromonas macacae]|uniref:SusD family n=1 Tax=Porphyromonas macacae TaxID=28115 RepID=A0A379DGR9_9PORP|nr:RagB/SusD family nutrient uptake outer membrane protein [Porphyromonas macacae]SUB77569.1 SusD family [Porphyromonas macacae]
MRTIYKVLFSCLGILALTSCDKFLDVRPKGVVIPEKCEHYETLLNFPQLLKSSDSYPNYITDDVFLPQKDVVTRGIENLALPLKRLYSFDSEVYGDGEKDGLWNFSYNRIYTYNVIVQEVLGSTDATEEHKNQVRAEALMGRAFEYLTLVNAYGNHYDPATAAKDPGVPLLLDQDINKKDLKRASVQEVYDQIKADLNEAAKYLPERPVANAFRASKPVGFGLLARMYLYMGDYQKALDNARKSLEHNSNLLDLKPYKVVDPRKYIGRIDVPQNADNPENTYIRLAPYVFGLSSSVYGSEELINLYDKEKDKRFLLYFTRRIGSTTTEYDLWAPFIYANMAVATPEIYLIAAECEARLGNKDKAISYLNTLRDHRIIDNKPLKATDEEDALRQVLDERRREMVFQGCTRLIDLKRLNREPRFAKTIVHDVDGTKHTLLPNDPKYILPIPPTVLRFNPNMIPNKR